MKMKKSVLYLLLIVFAIVTLCTSCATIYKDDISSFSQIITVAGKTKDELFVSAASWFVDSFKDSKSVLEISDKQSGLLKGKYTTEVAQGLTSMIIESIITVETKDGKVRLTISNPTSIKDSYDYSSSPLTENALNLYEADRIATALSLETALKSTPANW